MQKKYIYSIAGLFIGAFVNILFNLIAAAIQQRAIGEKFNNQTIWWMVIFAVVGLLVGYWLSIGTESDNSTDYRMGIRARGITSKKGRFIADERTGQGIDAENVTASDDVTLTSSNLDESYRYSTRERISGSIDARGMNAGGNIAIFNGSVPMSEQLEFFQNQLNIPVGRLNRYNQLKLKSYWEVWRKLQLLKLAGDALWKELNNDTLLNFSEQLRQTQEKVEESAIFFDEEDYVSLQNIFKAFGDYKLGKIHLRDIRSRNDYRWVFESDMIQVDQNRNYKNKYESLLNKIRIAFRERLCS